MDMLIKVGFYFLVVISLGIILSKYIYKVFIEEKHFLSKIITPIEKVIYRTLGIKEENMSGKKYFISIICFSMVSFIWLFLLLVFQHYLPLNKENIPAMRLDTAFHTAVSYITNTNYQNYEGQVQVSEFVQMMGLTVQNFLSAGVGISVLFVLFRAFFNNKKEIGNFWKDLVRIELHILIPLSIITSVLLISIGVIQTFEDNKIITTLEGNEQIITLGPVASQVAIKQLGSNGGGYFSTNSTHPFENPNAISNFIEMVAMLLLPISLVFTFGKIIKDKRQPISILITMLILFFIGFSIIQVAQNNPTAMEGKETRFGIVNSSLWSAVTTSASNGSVNSMFDSQPPLAGIMFLWNMAIGGVIFGSVGTGLYTMLAFIILTVFIAGLMIGRTPEYLSKKIEEKDVKMALLIILTSPICILIFSSISIMSNKVMQSISNTGAHGFTQVLYAFVSTGANNGSAFAGFEANTVFLNIILSLCMFISRFIPMYGVIELSHNLLQKQNVATTVGTLQTHTPLFVVITIVIICILGGLSFFPALSLGPIAETLISI